MTTIGTNHFTSFSAACRYYRTYGETNEDVKNKIEEGLITIGAPKLKAGERLELIDNLTRYAIVKD